MERRQRRCVLLRDNCSSITEWANQHVRSHYRLGNARKRTGQLTCPEIDLGRGAPTPH